MPFSKTLLSSILIAPMALGAIISPAVIPPPTPLASPSLPVISSLVDPAFASVVIRPHSHPVIASSPVVPTAPPSAVEPAPATSVITIFPTGGCTTPGAPIETATVVYGGAAPPIISGPPTPVPSPSTGLPPGFPTTVFPPGFPSSVIPSDSHSATSPAPLCFMSSETGLPSVSIETASESPSAASTAPPWFVIPSAVPSAAPPASSCEPRNHGHGFGHTVFEIVLLPPLCSNVSSVAS